MSDAFIVDAHLHIGYPGVFFSPESGPRELLATMDRTGIRLAVCTDQVSVFEGANRENLIRLREVFEQSEGRIHYLGVFDPRRSEGSLSALEKGMHWPGFVGLKLHPSIHRVPAEDASYEPAWRFASEYDLPILTHSWSVSDYNPVQRLSTPDRFEGHVRKFSEVRLVLGHSGGRGTGRLEAMRMAKEYSNVYLDFAGDIFCYRLIERFVEAGLTHKVLFGSDFPWLDPRANLTRVLLADVSTATKSRILCDNAAEVYGLARAS